MTEDEIRNETPEDDEIEAHGLKETAAAGLSAAALLAAGAGTAAAATPSAHPTKADPTLKMQKADPSLKMEKKTEAMNKIAKKTDATFKGSSARASARADATIKVNPAE